MRGMIWFVRACAAYNFIGALTFLTPGALGLVGVQTPDSLFWVWLPGLRCG